MAEPKYIEIPGSGKVRVTTQADLKRARAEVMQREVVPLEGTNMSLFHTIIPSWWAANGLSSSSSWMPGDGRLAERVWVTDRCIQLNSQQIASMPIRYFGPEEPAWVSHPDPNLFPNGIGSAIHAIVSQYYGWGYSVQYVLDEYADGYPRMWTVLSSEQVQIKFENGARTYKYGEEVLDPSRVIHIDRNPSLAPHGTSALRAYAQNAWGLLAAGNQSMTVNQGGVPSYMLKPQKKITSDQAQNMKAQWMEMAATRNGGPAVLPPDLDLEVLSFNPKDLSLLETQEWNARTLATAFGVPSVILNMALQGGLTYQNPLALMQMWWLTELRTTADRIAEAFTARTLPRGQSIEFDATAILTEGAITTNETQTSPVAAASPTQASGVRPARLTAIGGSP